MGLLQNTTAYPNNLVLGNFKIEYATVGTTIASGASAWTNLGQGIGGIATLNHNVTMLDIQSANGPDPVEGVAAETYSITGDLIEVDTDRIIAVNGGLLSTGTAVSTTTTVSGYTTLTGGGCNTITPKSFKITNRRMIYNSLSATYYTAETIIQVYKATFKNGPQMTVKSDNDADPVMIMPFEIEAIVDTSRSAGDQLYRIQKWATA